MKAPFTRTAQWRWQPVEWPVVFSVPMSWPADDLRPDVDAGRRLARHVGVPGHQAGGVGDDHQPGPRRRVVWVVADEHDDAGASRVNGCQARRDDVDALMEVGAVADPRLGRTSRCSRTPG